MNLIPLFKHSLCLHLHVSRKHHCHRVIGACHTVLACPVDTSTGPKSIQLVAQPNRKPTQFMTQNFILKVSLHVYTMLDPQLPIVQTEETVEPHSTTRSGRIIRDRHI